MTTAAVSRRLGAILFGHDGLNSLEDGVHSGVTMSAGFPLIENLGMASGRAARRGSGERPGVESTACGSAGQAGSERPVFPVQEAVALRELIDVTGAWHDERDQGRER